MKKWNSCHARSVDFLIVYPRALINGKMDYGFINVEDVVQIARLPL